MSDPQQIGDLVAAEWHAGGDREELFRQLFLAYHHAVFSFFLRYGFPREEALDLAQETFVKVWSGLDRFRRDARFRTWLFQIMTNLAQNRLRGRRALKRGAPELPLAEVGEAAVGAAPGGRRGETGGPLEGMLADERSRLLHAAMGELPPQMRRCMTLRVDQQLGYTEIAELLGISLGAVKAHLFQGRQQLKTRLGPWLQET
ncbi:MAG TPA: sigma-70 family RNA polymerase sigma factor [Thermoanaerobaculia bacterium]|nr:sigma-70 family RNA polymerase sigma factor [Thermoanaerobaculia bacterium]